MQTAPIETSLANILTRDSLKLIAAQKQISSEIEASSGVINAAR
jgi:hypothetical protein